MGDNKKIKSQIEKAGDKTKTAWKKSKKIKVSLRTIIILAVILVIFFAFVFPAMTKKDGKQIVEATATLEKVIKTSSLSTYETIYNGVAEAKDDKNENVLYYVNYVATVKAGLDFEKIGIDINEDEHKVIVKMPKITLQEPTVSIEDMDYIFVKKHLKEQGIVADAYQICIDDVRKESSEQESIYKYASQNARNLIKGLLSPFVEQLEGEYEIEFVEGE